MLPLQSQHLPVHERIQPRSAIEPLPLARLPIPKSLVKTHSPIVAGKNMQFHPPRTPRHRTPLSLDYQSGSNALTPERHPNIERYNVRQP